MRRPVKTTLMQPVDAHESDHRLRSVQYYLPLSEEEKDRFENRFRARLQNCSVAAQQMDSVSP